MAKDNLQDNSITVVIPAYDREKYISATITSCLHQSLPIDEILVIDNHSSDKTYSIAKELASQHKQVRVIRNKKNIGMIGNWNRGIKHSTSKYVSLLHSDDLLPFNWCEIVKSATNKEYKRTPYLYFGTVVCIGAVAGRNHIISRIKTFNSSQYFKPSTSVTALWKNFFGNPGCSSALIYRKKLFDEIGYFDPQWSAEADQEFHIRALNQYPSYHINEDLVYYRIHDLQGYDFKQETETDDRSVDRILNSLEIQKLRLLDKKLISYNYCGVLIYILYYIINGKRKSAQKLFANSSDSFSYITVLNFPRFILKLFNKRYFSRYTLRR